MIHEKGAGKTRIKAPRNFTLPRSLGRAVLRTKQGYWGEVAPAAARGLLKHPMTSLKGPGRSPVHSSEAVKDIGFEAWVQKKVEKSLVI